MMSAITFFEKINYKAIVTKLVDFMAANSEEFITDQTSFNETISFLEAELGQHTSPSVADLVDAIDQQICSTLLFSYYLGLKANFDHFINPLTRTFMDTDPEIYLRENIAWQLPDYRSAQHMREQFYNTLSTTQKDKYDEDIATYVCHLETIGPKLAHYYGYLLGNQLFPRVVLGYTEDTQLSFCYLQTLEKYLGFRVT